MTFRSKSAAVEPVLESPRVSSPRRFFKQHQQQHQQQELQQQQLQQEHQLQQPPQQQQPQQRKKKGFLRNLVSSGIGVRSSILRRSPTDSFTFSTLSERDEGPLSQLDSNLTNSPFSPAETPQSEDGGMRTPSSVNGGVLWSGAGTPVSYQGDSSVQLTPEVSSVPADNCNAPANSPAWGGAEGEGSEIKEARPEDSRKAGGGTSEQNPAAADSGEMSQPIVPSATSDSTPSGSTEFDGQYQPQRGVYGVYGTPDFNSPAYRAVLQAPSTRCSTAPSGGGRMGARTGSLGSIPHQNTEEGSGPIFGSAEFSSGPLSSSLSEDGSLAAISNPAVLKSLIEGLQSPLVEDRVRAAATLRKSTKTDNEGRKAAAEAGAVEHLVDMMQEPHVAAVEAGLYALLVLCLNEEVRWNLNGAIVIPLLLRLASHRSFSLQEGSAALLLYLSSIDENRILIGNSGGIPVLIDRLNSGNARMKRDVLRTLFNLSLLSVNKTTLLQHKVVNTLVRLINHAPAHKLTEIAVCLLRNLATRDEGRDAIVSHHGIQVLTRVLDYGSALGKEEAVSTLLVLSTRNPIHRDLVRAANLMPSLKSLAVSGTPRAKARTEELIHVLLEGTKGNGRA